MYPSLNTNDNHPCFPVITPVVINGAIKYLVSMKKTKLAEAVGNKMRRRRENLSFSQEAFADYIGFDRSNYGAIERGERNISIQSLARIAVGLKVDIGDLFPALSEVKKLV